MTTIEPFVIEASDSALADLRERLSRTRWADAETVSDWSQGVPLSYMQELRDYWLHDYDWREREAQLNQFAQFTTRIDGLSIHFLHLRSPHQRATPLIMSHGWPGSFVEFSKVLGPLTDPVAHGGAPEDAFHVVCPSLPGFGFSEKPTETGCGVEQIADIWIALMKRLGYVKYVAQGGDWGSMITTAMAIRDPQHCQGIHLTMPIVTADPDTMNDLTEQEESALAAWKQYKRWDHGYSSQQSTRPQSLAYGLVDSPVAQAAWVIEKFWSWTDCQGHPENAVSRDELIDNVMLYWLPATGGSSARIYWESWGTALQDPIAIPVAVSMFPKEIFRSSKRWCEKRFANLAYYNYLDKGGHFAALEQPALFVRELRSAFTAIRDSQ
ncbi:MAG: epoxide hydrolase family protein [Pseudomonadota bacterium]